MRAILVEHFGGAEAMRAGELEIPEPARDEVLVRILAAGVGPWDVEQRRGGWRGPLPYVPGAQFAGLVVGETGADAGFEDGAPVHGWPGPGGCYAQYVTCHVERLAPVPAGLRVTDAAAVPVDALTADQGITGILAVGAADRVLITAAAIIRRDQKEKLHITTPAHHAVAWGSFSGLFWGVLIGLLFLNLAVPRGGAAAHEDPARGGPEGTGLGAANGLSRGAGLSDLIAALTPPAVTLPGRVMWLRTASSSLVTKRTSEQERWTDEDRQ